MLIYRIGEEAPGAGTATQAGGEEQKGRAGQAQQGKDYSPGEHARVRLTCLAKLSAKYNCAFLPSISDGVMLLLSSYKS